MAVEIDAIQNAKSIGWADALLARLAAGSISTPNITVVGGIIILDTGGPRIDNSSGTVRFRNNANSANANISCGQVNVHSSISIVGADDSIEKWRLYRNDGESSIYMRDMVNSRMQATFSPGANAAVALTQIHSKLSVDGNVSLLNSTTAMELYIYNTYTSGSVYERGFIKFSGNALKIGCEHVGASQRDVHISNIPTSNPGPGILWNNAGTLAIGT